MFCVFIALDDFLIKSKTLILDEYFDCFKEAQCIVLVVDQARWVREYSMRQLKRLLEDVIGYDLALCGLW